MSATFRALARRLCSSAATPKRSPTTREYRAPEQILEDPAVQSLLKQSNLTPEAPLADPRTKLELLAYISKAYGVAVASNAYLSMTTANDIATWFSSQLKPCAARPHARNLIRHTLAEDGNVDKLDDRIDLERDAVQQELEARIPSNVVLDERTFLKVQDRFVDRSRKPKPQLGKR